MNAVLWSIQGLVALAYLMAGFMKATRPLEQLSKQMAWAREVPSGLVRFIGIAELLGAIGLIVPLLTNILPGLTVAAAAGLVVVQVFAIIFHVSRSETSSRLAMNAALLLLALFVVVGRLVIVPIA